MLTTLRIYDLGDRKVLALDLRDLIDLLAPDALKASWTVSPVSMPHPTLNCVDHEFLATGRGADQLETLAVEGLSVSGMALAEYARVTHQVIWGQFVATRPGQTGAWVTIRAIDSTFYEVTTSDETVLAKIRSAYKDVRVAAGPFCPLPPTAE